MRRPDETWPGMPAAGQNTQPHDAQVAGRRVVKDNPTPPRFYCIETICAPCGVVIGWAKFTKAESPTNILSFLQSVYPTEDSKPSYICIDKACLVLRSSIANGSWESWKKTSCFIVDSYHYVNHRATDGLCRTFCNPAPMDGSAPNLVLVERNEQGEQYYKRAFNTQACEQLNAWLGGFEGILKRLKPGNFNWFLHTMLFYHTKQVIYKQIRKESQEEKEESADDE
jgi:hypothetical protein